MNMFHLSFPLKFLAVFFISSLETFSQSIWGKMKWNKQKGTQYIICARKKDLSLPKNMYVWPKPSVNKNLLGFTDQKLEVQTGDDCWEE